MHVPSSSHEVLDASDRPTERGKRGGDLLGGAQSVSED